MRYESSFLKYKSSPASVSPCVWLVCTLWYFIRGSYFVFHNGPGLLTHADNSPQCNHSLAMLLIYIYGSFLSIKFSLLPVNFVLCSGYCSPTSIMLMNSILYLSFLLFFLHVKRNLRISVTQKLYSKFYLMKAVI